MAVGVTAAYVVAARLGFELAVLAEQVTTVWAPTGIALAALLLWGPLIVAGRVAGRLPRQCRHLRATLDRRRHCHRQHPGGGRRGVAAAKGSRRSIPRLRRLADVARLIVLGAVVATTISATIGVATLCLAALQPWDRFGDLWLTWWTGDALGVLVIAPAILTSTAWLRRHSRRDWLYLGAFVVGSIAITQVVFGELLGVTFGDGVLHYVVFPLAVATAVRFGQPATALVILAVSAVAIWNTVAGRRSVRLDRRGSAVCCPFRPSSRSWLPRA